MGIELTFEITFRSNYHVGAGYGQGFNVDSAILREADGTPVIRGSALAGLLRGGAYRLLQLPPLAKYSAEKVLNRLFGSPAHPKRWHIGSARPREFLPAGRDSQAVQHVRIDPRTRRAAPRKLFSQEEGVAGQVFVFTATCPDADAPALDEAALMVAAARNVRQLGRSRRRGLGECLIRLTGVQGVPSVPGDWQEWFLERFGERWMERKPAPPPPQVESARFSLGDESLPHYAGEPVRLRLIVRLDEPLLIARRAPAGNQFEAREAIPGSVILGVLANEAASRNDLTRDDTYRDFVSLFLRGGIIFPTLYPALFSKNNLYPTIPAPLGLLTCSIVPFSEQNDGHGTYLPGKHNKCPKCKERNVDSRLEPIAGFVILRRKGKKHVFTPKRSSELHIQIDEETGRVKKGQLYGYTVLDAGQYFVGELTCASEEAWKQLEAMTGIAERQSLTWRLGKARRRGYGKVTAWLERCDGKEPVWVQLPLEQRVTDIQQPLFLTLLTDTIIQNRWGQQAVGFAKEWLQETLGLGEIEIKDAYARSRVVDSFNSHLGLPRWRDTALTAGSVVWFTLKSLPDDWQRRLAQLERDGIGLRCNEGFGRVAFNHPVYDQIEKLTRSDVRLDDAMQLGEKPREDRFMRNWEKRLSRLPDTLDARFAALARWLHTQSDQSPAEILNLLHAEFKDGKCRGVNLRRVFGEPDDALIEAIGGDAEYGTRSKDNFFLTDGKAPILQVCDLLKTLENEKEQYRQEGIQRLAGYLAAAATKKGGNE